MPPDRYLDMLVDCLYWYMKLHCSLYCVVNEIRTLCSIENVSYMQRHAHPIACEARREVKQRNVKKNKEAFILGLKYLLGATLWFCLICL